MAQRSVLAYARAQEASADQAAASFLGKTGQSGKGMLDLFQTLANQSIASTRFVSPYALTHPMPLERIRNLEQIVKSSPYYDKVDPPCPGVLRHQLMQAKLFGFLNSAQVVYQKYPASDRSLPAQRGSIAAFRIGDSQNALPGNRFADRRGAERPIFLGNPRARRCSRAAARPRPSRRSGRWCSSCPTMALSTSCWPRRWSEPSGPRTPRPHFPCSRWCSAPSRACRGFTFCAGSPGAPGQFRAGRTVDRGSRRPEGRQEACHGKGPARPQVLFRRQPGMVES